MALLGSNVLLAQQSISSTDILANIPSSYKALGENEMLTFLKQNPQQLPWINKLEFRTETDQWDLLQQEYVFRFNKNGSKERKAQQKLSLQNAAIYKIEDQIFQNKILLQRYLFIADWHYNLHLSKILTAQKIILKDQQKVLQKMAENDLAVDLKAIFKTEDQIQEIDKMLLQKENKLQFLQRQLELSPETKNTRELDSSDWPGIEQMKTVIQQMSLYPETAPPLLLQAAKANQALADHLLEDAKGKKIIDFIQLKYSGNEKRTFQKEFSLGMGINIPTSSSARIKKNRSQLKYLEEKQSLQLLQIKRTEKIKRLQADFESALQIYKLNQANTKEEQLKKIYDKYLQRADNPVAILLHIKERLLNKELILAESEYDICLRYLQLLDYSGEIYEGPLVNYLSADLKKIKSSLGD